MEPPPVANGAYVPDIIVALTDGASNFGPDPLEAATQAATRGVRVYTIGFGTADGGQLDRNCATAFRGSEPAATGSVAAGSAAVAVAAAGSGAASTTRRSSRSPT